MKRTYRGRKTWLPIVELAFGLYFTGALWFAIDAGIFTSLPFLVLFQVGFLYVGVSSLFQGRLRTAPRRRSPRPRSLRSRPEPLRGAATRARSSSGRTTTGCRRWRSRR